MKSVYMSLRLLVLLAANGKIKPKLEGYSYKYSSISLIDSNLNWTANRIYSNHSWLIFIRSKRKSIEDFLRCIWWMLTVPNDKHQIMESNGPIKFCDASAVNQTECGISINMSSNDIVLIIIMIIIFGTSCIVHESLMDSWNKLNMKGLHCFGQHYL